MNKEEILFVLKNGGLVIIPTDTTYGLCADATNISAIGKVFNAKKRDNDKPLLVLVSSVEMLEEYIYPPTEKEKQLMEKFWPGPLTILFKKNEKLSDLLTANSPLVGVRLPDDNKLINIIKEFGKPIIATSANISGEDVIVNTKDLNKEILDYVDYIYDDGDKKAPASTLVRVDDDKINILRRGELADKIDEEFGNLEII